MSYDADLQFVLGDADASQDGPSRREETAAPPEAELLDAYSRAVVAAAEAVSPAVLHLQTGRAEGRRALRQPARVSPSPPTASR